MPARIPVLFHDGRVSRSDIYENGFNTPAQEWLPEGLSGLLAVQALFPLTSQFEMAGDPVENEVGGARYDRIDAVWPFLAKRVRVIPEYGALFTSAFEDVEAAPDITITHIANALAAFQGTEYQSFDSPFDALSGRGQGGAWRKGRKPGWTCSMARPGAAPVIRGPLLTDHGFHALMLPHFGPGRTRAWDNVVRDVGRMAVSDRIEDAYRFRTPSLRNVALTAPYGHNGAYPTLEGIVRHHLDPAAGFASWTPEMAALPEVPWLAKADFLAFADRLGAGAAFGTGRYRTGGAERRGGRPDRCLPSRPDRHPIGQGQAGCARTCAQRAEGRTMSDVLVIGVAVVDFVFAVGTLPDRAAKYRGAGGRGRGGRMRRECRRRHRPAGRHRTGRHAAGGRPDGGF